METVKLTNEEILRVFVLYFNCCQINEGHRSFPSGLMNFDYIRHGLCSGDFKIELQPLSAITDEHAIEVAKIYFGLDFYDKTMKNGGLRFHGKTIVIRLYIKWEDRRDDSCTPLDYAAKAIMVHQYLIQQSYAVPIFFGINHPLNGKTPIELEIAIDKTTINP